MSTHTVFYSWHYDLDNSTNRSFIEDALHRAAKEISRDEEFEIYPTIDRDTQGVPGSPNIVTTIFEKIKRADVFVADVSFITPPDYTGRRTPNPNVLIELGYAAHCHGWGRMLCVFNEATGKVEDLPFDIRQHSITRYSLVKGEDKMAARKLLVSQLRDKIRLILTTPDAHEAEEQGEFLSSLANVIVNILIYGSEYKEGGQDARPYTTILSQFRIAAPSLRELAPTAAAEKLGMIELLEDLASKLEELVNTSYSFEMFEWFEDKLGKVLEAAESIKKEKLNDLDLNPEECRQVMPQLEELQRRLASINGRARKMLEDARDNAVKIEATRIGEQLYRIGHWNFDRWKAGLSSVLRTYGRRLHLLDALTEWLEPEKADELIVNTIRESHEQITSVLGVKPKR